jgi:hypothetical protein
MEIMKKAIQIQINANKDGVCNIPNFGPISLVFIWNSDLKATFGISPFRSHWNHCPKDIICALRAHWSRKSINTQRLQQVQLLSRHEAGKNIKFSTNMVQVFIFLRILFKILQ